MELTLHRTDSQSDDDRQFIKNCNLFMRAESTAKIRLTCPLTIGGLLNDIRELNAERLAFRAAFDNDNVDDFVPFFVGYDEAIAKNCSNPTADTTFLHLAILSGKPNIAEFIISKGGVISKIVPCYSRIEAESDDELWKYQKSHRNLINVLYALACYGNGKQLEKLFDKCAKREQKLAVLRFLTARFETFTLPTVKNFASDGDADGYCRIGHDSFEIDCLDVMNCNGHSDALLVFFAELEKLEDHRDLFAATKTHWLRAASRCGHLEVVKILIRMLRNPSPEQAEQKDANQHQQQALIDEPDPESSRRALHYAVLYGQDEVVAVLLKDGHADVNVTTTGCLGYPIALAAALGRQKIVSTLLDHDSPEGTLKKESMVKALHAAAAQGHHHIVELLLGVGDGGASSTKQKNRTVTWSDAEKKSSSNDRNESNSCQRVGSAGSAGSAGSSTGEAEKFTVNAADDNGNTALLVAVQAGQTKVVEKLVSLRAKLEHVNAAGDDVWSLAVLNGNDDVISYLMRLFDKRKLDYVKRKVPLLHETVKADRADLAHWFCRRGLDPMARDDQGNTFIHVAAFENRPYVLKRLLPGLPGEVTSAKNAAGRTALHLAALGGNVESVIKILKYATDDLLDARDADDNTALHVAVNTGHAAVVRVIAEEATRSAAIRRLLDLKDGGGHTALSRAVADARIDCVRALRGASADCRDPSGLTALHRAAMGAGRTPMIVQAVLETFYRPPVAGGELDALAERGPGDTPLMMAAATGSIEPVKALLEYGADVRATNRRGENLIHSLARMTVTSSAIEVWSALVDFYRKSPDHTPYTSRILLRQLTKQRCGATQGGQRRGPSPLELAAALGAVDILQAMIDATSPFAWRNDNDAEDDDAGVEVIQCLDVGRLVPESLLPDIDDDEGEQRDKSYPQEDGECAVRSRRTSTSGRHRQQQPSCLEVMTQYCTDDQMVTMMRRIEPLRTFVVRFSSIRSQIHSFAFAVHVIFMSLLTVYVLRPVPVLGAGDVASWNGRSTAFIVWPLVLLCYELVCLLKWTRSYLCRPVDCDNDCDHVLGQMIAARRSKTERGLHLEGRLNGPRSCCSCRGLRYVVAKLTTRSYVSNVELLTHATTLAFIGLVAAWCGYAAYLPPTLNAKTAAVYLDVTAATLIVGWIQSLEYVRGFAPRIHAFVVTLKLFFFRDLLRLAFIYVFVAVGFVSALQLYLAAAAADDDDDGTGSGLQGSSYGRTFFRMFVSTLSLGYLADEVADAGAGTATAVRLIVGGHLLATTVTLMSALIAATVRLLNGLADVEETVRCVESLKFVAWIAADDLFWLRSVGSRLVGRFVAGPYYAAIAISPTTRVYERSHAVRRIDAADRRTAAAKENGAEASAAAAERLRNEMKSDRDRIRLVDERLDGIEEQVGRLYDAVLRNRKESRHKKSKTRSSKSNDGK